MSVVQVAQPGDRGLRTAASTTEHRAMSAVLVSLIAVAGTLLGSFSTYLFQRRTARHTELVARAERLRQDRLAACGAYAEAITDVKRAVISAWFRREERDEQWRTAMTEADRLGAAAEGAMIRMLLLVDDHELQVAAQAVAAQIGGIRGTRSIDELKAAEVAFADTRSAFITEARRLTAG
jgi:hypothetical protein